MIQANTSCRALLRQIIPLARDFARPKAGNNRLANNAIIEITTNSSTNVNARRGGLHEFGPSVLSRASLESDHPERWVRQAAGWREIWMGILCNFCGDTGSYSVEGASL